MHKLRSQHLQRLQVCMQQVHLHMVNLSHSRMAQSQGLSPDLQRVFWAAVWGMYNPLCQNRGLQCRA